MSSISGASSSTSSTSSMTAAQAAQAAAAEAQAELKAAGQSLISGSTGNTTLDPQTMVTALVNAQVAGQQAALQIEASNDSTQSTAIGQLSAALSQLQVGLAPLFNGQLASTFDASISASGVTTTGVTASTGDGAVAGSYTLNVSQIATAQSLTSGSFTSSQAADMGTGTVNIVVGGKSMQLNIDSSNDTLSDIASAINSSSSNPGVTASIITGANGTQFLALNAGSSGASNTINITVSGDSSGSPLSDLAVTTDAAGVDTDSNGNPTTGSTLSSATTALGWTQSTAAQDAQFTLNGKAATSTTNTITSVLPGVTLNLSTSTVLNTNLTLAITPDNSTIESDVLTFVSDYNAVVSTIASLTSFDSGAAATTPGSGAGPLLGDSMINQIEATFGTIVGSRVTSDGVSSTLAQIGVTLNSDGTMSVDSTTLDNAVQNNPAQVSALFNSTNGIGEQLNTQITAFTQTGGIIDVRNEQITSDLQNVTTQTTALQGYIQQLTTQYTNQFDALNNLLSTTNNETQYLTQLFGGANSGGTLNSSSS